MLQKFDSTKMEFELSMATIDLVFAQFMNHPTAIQNMIRNRNAEAKVIYMAIQISTMLHNLLRPRAGIQRELAHTRV
jgi:hypothetical protein